MTSPPNFQHLAFFTRLLDAAPAVERYRLAAEQITHAEHLGFDTAWVAQHHFHEHEGGLPSPFVFLGHLAARTSRIRLGTGIVTLPLELPVRVAEDAIVLDLLSSGRLELGVGNGCSDRLNQGPLLCRSALQSPVLSLACMPRTMSSRSTPLACFAPCLRRNSSRHSPLKPTAAALSGHMGPIRAAH